MIEFVKNRYVIAYSLIYIFVLTIVVINDVFPLEEILSRLVIIGIIFSIIAYLLSKSSKPIFSVKPQQKKEPLLIISIIIYFILFITFYKYLINIILPEQLQSNGQVKEIIKISFKVFFIVIVPVIIYKVYYNFSLYDWGIKADLKAVFRGKSVLIFLVFSIIMISFQYFAGNGAKPIREGAFSLQQLLIAFPISYLSLIISVGLVEEFFFRSFLQSRIAIILKSEIGGIAISALIFGLAHAPGIYLRGAGVIANLEAAPSLLTSIGFSILGLSIAGFFLSIILVKTRNLWLIVGIHAMVDLLPNLAEFIKIWNIG